MLCLQHTKKRIFMKQSLLSFLLAIVSILTFGTTLNAAVTTVTFTSSDFTTFTEAGKISVEKDGVSIEISQGAYNSAGQIRIYKNQTLTVSSETTITGIAFTCSESKYGPSNFSLKTTGTYNGSKGTWTDAANTVTFCAKEGRSVRPRL